MTISEAHRQFRFILDKADGVNYPNFRPEEIDLLLNIAQDRYVKQRYSRNNPKRTSFEEEQKRTEDLKAIVKENAILATTVRIENVNYPSYLLTLTTDHWFTIYERAVINYPGCNQTINTSVDGTFLDLVPSPFAPRGAAGSSTTTGKYAKVIPTTHLELNNILDDEFNKPDKNTVLRIEFDGKVELYITSEATLKYYIYRYIKKPVRVSLTGNTTFELSDHTHSEIVDEAIKIALENIEAKRTGTFTQVIDNLKE